MTCRHRYAYTDSHMHTRGHPGRFKDRSCWTHPHGDKGRGRPPLHSGAPGVGHTHGRPRAEPRDGLCTYPRTGSQGAAVTHRGKEESLSPTPRKSLSNACMHAHMAICTQPHDHKRLYHSEAHTCAHVPSRAAAVIACHDSNCHSGKQTKKNPRLHINTFVHNLATSIFLDSSVEPRFCRQ